MHCTEGHTAATVARDWDEFRKQAARRGRSYGETPRGDPAQEVDRVFLFNEERQFSPRSLD